MRLKGPVLLAALLLGSAVVTFVFWRQISFGRRLDDAELAEVLTSESPSRRAMHGVVELTERWREQQPGMDRWKERLVAVSRRPEGNVRRSAAWAMQFAAADPTIVARLRELVAADPDESVRRNAACSLSLSPDRAEARPVLRAMLQPYTVPAPADATVESVLDVGRRPREDEMVVRLRDAAGRRVEAVTTVPGRVVEARVKSGDVVRPGDPLVVLAPDASHVLSAATALAYAGTAEDVPLLRAFTAAGAEVPAHVAEQVRAALAAIERRAGR